MSRAPTCLLAVFLSGGFAAGQQVAGVPSAEPAPERPNRVVRDDEGFFAPIVTWDGGAGTVSIRRAGQREAGEVAIDVPLAGDLIWPGATFQDETCILVGSDPERRVGVVQQLRWSETAGTFTCDPATGMRSLPGADLVGAAYDPDGEMLFLLDATNSRIVSGHYVLGGPLPTDWETLVDVRHAPVLAHAAEHTLGMSRRDDFPLAFRLHPYPRGGAGPIRFVRVDEDAVESGVIAGGLELQDLPAALELDATRTALRIVTAPHVRIRVFSIADGSGRLPLCTGRADAAGVFRAVVPAPFAPDARVEIELRGVVRRRSQRFELGR